MLPFAVCCQLFHGLGEAKRMNPAGDAGLGETSSL
jgi:hypothetical protein